MTCSREGKLNPCTACMNNIVAVRMEVDHQHRGVTSILYARTYIVLMCLYINYSTGTGAPVHIYLKHLVFAKCNSWIKNLGASFFKGRKRLDSQYLVFQAPRPHAMLCKLITTLNWRAMPRQARPSISRDLSLCNIFPSKESFPFLLIINGNLIKGQPCSHVVKQQSRPWWAY